MKKQFIVFSLSATVLLTSCGGEQKTPEEQSKPAETTETTTAVEVETPEEQNFILPSPLQIASIMKRAGLTYQDGLTAAPDLASSFSSQYEKTLAFGIYSADLAYCVLNKHPQEGLKYIKVVKQVGEELGINTLLNDEKLVKSFENNLDNDDSLLYVLATVQERLDDYLENNEKEYMHVLIFAGAWTEGMYLGANSAQLSDSKIAQKLVEQMVILDNLIRGLEAYPNQSEELKELTNDLKDIKTTFESFEALNGQKIEDVDLDQIHLTENDLKVLSDKIVALRNKMLNK